MSRLSVLSLWATPVLQAALAGCNSAPISPFVEIEPGAPTTVDAPPPALGQDNAAIYGALGLDAAALAAEAGMVPMLKDGIAKALAGLTSLDEVLRVVR